MPHSRPTRYSLCCAVHANDRHAVTELLKSFGADHSLISPSGEHIIETAIRLNYHGMLSDLLRDRRIAASLTSDILHHILCNALFSRPRLFAVRLFFKRGFFAILTEEHRDSIIKNGMSYLPLARLFLESGIDVNYRFSDGSTPLIAAVKSSSYDAAMLLLSHGAYLPVVDDTGRTALVWAVEGQESRGTYKFIKSFCDLQLIRALSHGSFIARTSYDPITSALLDIVCSDDRERNEKALSILLSNEEPYCMTYLCGLLGILDKRDLFIRLCTLHPFDKIDHESAYRSAVNSGNHEFADTVLTIAIRNDCNPEDLWRFAFIAAAQADLRYIERLKTVIPQPWSSTWFLYRSLLLTACKDGNDRMFDLILDNNKPDPWLMAYCLCCAIGSGSDTLIDRLMALVPADFDHSKLFDPVNEYSGTPLITAAKSNNFIIAERLIQSGADVNACSAFHTTALAEAVNDGNCAMARLLIGYGAKWNKHMNYIVQTEFINPPMCAVLLESGIVSVKMLIHSLTRVGCSSSASRCGESLIAFLLHTGRWDDTEFSVRDRFIKKAEKCHYTASLELIASFED